MRKGQAQRVATLKRKYGDEYFSRIGRVGFEVTTRLYFNGDSDAHVRWLVSCGKWAIDKDLSYAKPEIWGWPGLHPSEVKWLADWLDHTESNI